MRDTLEACTRKTRDAGLAVGSYAKNVEMARWLKSIGVQYVATMVDAEALARQYMGVIDAIRPRRHPCDSAALGRLGRSNSSADREAADADRRMSTGTEAPGS